MKNISTSNLRKDDVPQGSFDWSIFTQFALTFDPVSETTAASDQVPASATPYYGWTPVALRYFLYCWQRIGNNHGGLRPEEIDKIQSALSIFRSKI